MGLGRNISESANMIRLDILRYQFEQVLMQIQHLLRTFSSLKENKRTTARKLIPVAFQTNFLRMKHALRQAGVAERSLSLNTSEQYHA